jgi:transcription initiation factor TFIIH subunit 3
MPTTTTKLLPFLTMSKNAPTTESNSLLVLVLDASPLAWGERDLKRTVTDKAREAQGKRSIGPAILEEVLEAVQAFGSAFCGIERDAGLIIIAVADNEAAVVFPRKKHLQAWLNNPQNYAVDTRRFRSDLLSGVTELVNRASRKLEANPNGSTQQATSMASAFSLALCLINRFLVAARSGGVSALRNEQYVSRSSEDDGLIALIGNSKTKKAAGKQPSAWSPRIMLVQASEDRSRDYNAFMNCAFAAMKQNIVVDGCFLTGDGNKTSSAFLEQACDLTGGVFLAPSGAAQVGGALTEVLFSVFLAPTACRSSLNLPALNKVDFRARCFETAEVSTALSNTLCVIL